MLLPSASTTVTTSVYVVPLVTGRSVAGAKLLGVVHAPWNTTPADVLNRHVTDTPGPASDVNAHVGRRSLPGDTGGAPAATSATVSSR